MFHWIKNWPQSWEDLGSSSALTHNGCVTGASLLSVPPNNSLKIQNIMKGLLYLGKKKRVPY